MVWNVPINWYMTYRIIIYMYKDHSNSSQTWKSAIHVVRTNQFLSRSNKQNILVASLAEARVRHSKSETID